MGAQLLVLFSCNIIQIIGWKELALWDFVRRSSGKVRRLKHVRNLGKAA